MQLALIESIGKLRTVSSPLNAHTNNFLEVGRASKSHLLTLAAKVGLAENIGQDDDGQSAGIDNGGLNNDGRVLLANFVINIISRVAALTSYLTG